MPNIRTFTDQSRGVPVVTEDAALNDSDKDIAVPASKVWRLSAVFVSLTSTATVGNRHVVVEIRDASNNIVSEISAGANQAASLTRRYSFGVGLPADTSFGGPSTDAIRAPLPEMWLEAGWDVRVYDKAAVDAAADDMTVRVVAEEVVG